MVFYKFMPSKSRAEGLIAVLVVTAVWEKSLLCSAKGIWLWDSWTALRLISTFPPMSVEQTPSAARCPWTHRDSKREQTDRGAAQWIVLRFLVSPPGGWCHLLKWGLERWLCWLSVCHTITRTWVQASTQPPPAERVRVRQTQCCRRQDKPQVYSLASLFGEQQILW